jgi:hypothetical protein
MKKLLILPIIPMILLGSNNKDLEWVDKQIEAIKPPRTGVVFATVNRTKSPFYFPSDYVVTEKGKKVKRRARTTWRPLKLNMVLNKSAMIGGKWYKEGDRFRQYKVEKISTDSVLLTSGTKQLKLQIKRENPKIKLQTK